MPNLTQREKWIVLGLSIAAIIAHLLNLGLIPLMADECLRAMVAWEMMVSENYIVPTNWGDFYYRKPPLYNWIIIGFFKLFDSYSEFVFRLPSVIPHLLLAFATYYVSRKHIGQKAAVYAAFGFLLSGRLLTRDSMLGHIDLAFSLVTFLGFFTIYHFQKRERYWTMFLLSYVLAAAGVLMKGLPSFLFQGFTVVVWLVYVKQWKRLFSLAHFAGIAVFLLIVVGYFYAYSQYNSLETYFDELYGQAAMRTVVDKPWYEGILNIFTFPFENFGHLFPTSLLLVFMFRKGTIKRWLGNDFLAFVLLTLAVNVLPYWLSPGYYPRYLFMLYPLCFILGAEALVSQANTSHWLYKTVEWLFFAMGAILILASLGILFFDDLAFLWYREVGGIALALVTGGVLWLWFKHRVHRIFWAFAILILFRVGLDLFILPYRMLDDKDAPPARKAMAQLILDNRKEDWPIKVFDQAPMYKEFAFYLGVATGDVIERTTILEPETYYLVDDNRLNHMHRLRSIHHHKTWYKEYETHLCVMTDEAVEEYNQKHGSTK